MSLVSSETVLAASTAVFIIICLAFYAVGRKNRTDQSPFALKFVKEDDGALHIEVSGFSDSEPNRKARFKREYGEGRIVSHEGIAYAVDVLEEKRTGTDTVMVCRLKKLG